MVQDIPHGIEGAGACKRVLIVEDEMIVALALQAYVEAMGLEPLGPVSSAIAAQAVLDSERPDFVLMDYRLMDGLADSLAEMLRARDIPFAWLTGCSRWEVPSGSEPVLQKPWDPDVLRRILASVFQPLNRPATAE